MDGQGTCLTYGQSQRAHGLIEAARNLSRGLENLLCELGSRPDTATDDCDQTAAESPTILDYPSAAPAKDFTIPETPVSSPSGQTTPPTFRVEPRCECALKFLQWGWSWERDRWELICTVHRVSWATVPITAQAAEETT